MEVEGAGLRKSYEYGLLKKNSIEAVKNVHLSIKKNEVVGLLGKSGSGKSTIGLMLAGLLKPDSGKIFFNGEMLGYPYSKEIRKKIQIIFQHPELSFNPKWKLRKSLEEPFKLHNIPDKEKILKDLMGIVGLYAEHLGRTPGQLSGGELQRAALIRILILRPSFVILDEPTSMLDTITQAQLIKLLTDVQKKMGVGYLFITHDAVLAKLFCTRIYILENGSLIS